MDWKWYLFSFEGRLNRKPWWAFQVSAIILAALVAYLDTSPPTEISGTEMTFVLIAFFPKLAIDAKRWHDLDRSAWWILVQLIPLAGHIYTYIMCGFVAGRPEPNRYGPDLIEER
jgi:uncharacterized membrane protein YhaH (DUF805 family)